MPQHPSLGTYVDSKHRISEQHEMGSSKILLRVTPGANYAKTSYDLLTVLLSCESKIFALWAFRMCVRGRHSERVFCIRPKIAHVSFRCFESPRLTAGGRRHLKIKKYSHRKVKFSWVLHAQVATHGKMPNVARIQSFPISNIPRIFQDFDKTLKAVVILSEKAVFFDSYMRFSNNWPRLIATYKILF